MSKLRKDIQHRLLKKEHALDTFITLHTDSKNFRDAEHALQELFAFYDWVEALTNEDQRFWVKHATIAYGLEHLFINELGDPERLMVALRQPAFQDEVLSAFAPADPKIYAKEIMALARKMHNDFK